MVVVSPLPEESFFVVPDVAGTEVRELPVLEAAGVVICLVWLVAAVDAIVVFLSVVSGAVTITLQTAFFPLPSVAFTVIVTVPAFFPVTFPFAFTAAIFLLEEDHFTDLFVAFDGETVAFNVLLFPFVR